MFSHAGSQLYSIMWYIDCYCKCCHGDVVFSHTVSQGSKISHVMMIKYQIFIGKTPTCHVLATKLPLAIFVIVHYIMW